MLLILAAVSISMLAGENGIVNNAQIAKKQNEEATEKEIIEMAVNAAKIGPEGVIELTKDNIERELSELSETGYTVTPSSNNGFKVKTGKNEYNVDSDGKVTGPTAITPLTATRTDFFTWEDNGDGTCTITGIKENETKDPDGIGWYYDYYSGLDGVNVSEKNVVVPNKINGATVTEIGEYAFTSNITALNGTWDYAYYGISFETVVLPNTIKKIGEGAFMNCDNLNSITLPDSLTSIGCQAFRNWRNSSGLREINYNGTMEQWNSITIENSGGLGGWDYTDKLTNAKIICTDGIINE